MRNGRFKIIDRKEAINITENSFPLAGEKTSLRFGYDEGERATAIHLFGAPKEGLLGTGPLSTSTGVYGYSGQGVANLGIAMNAGLQPAWRNVTIKYYDGEGVVCNYVPTDRHLAAAIKGIEYWAREVSIENRIDEQAIKMGAGRTKIGREIGRAHV